MRFTDKTPTKKIVFRTVEQLPFHFATQQIQGQNGYVFISYPLACVASVSNRVIARKLEWKQKKVELRSPPPPPLLIFFCSCPSFLDEPREETLATQATYPLDSHLQFTDKSVGSL